MTGTRGGRYAVVVLLAALGASSPLPAQAPGIGGYQLVSEVRVTRVVSEFTYRAILTNASSAIAGATGTATSLTPSTVIVDGTLAFGAVAGGATVTSTDTFRFRHNRTVPFSWSNIVWSIVTVPANTAPVANAGADQTASVGGTVTLDGTASSDEDGDELGYRWTFTAQPSGSTVEFIDATAARPTFTPTHAGGYTAQLIVNDGHTDSLPDQVNLNVLAEPVVDSDRDGLSDDDERRLGTDPDNPDTDGDGYRDGDEAAAGTDPTDAASTPGFSLELSATTASVCAGSSTIVVFRVRRDPGFVAPVTVALAAPPDGVSSRALTLPDGANVDAIRIAVHPTVAPGVLQLDVAAAALAVTRIARVTLSVRPPQPRAQQIIAEALAAGTIDLYTSLVYRAYAIFHDPRLPEAYRGSGSSREDPLLLDEIREALPMATPEVRTQLEPFTLRPAHEASWYSQILASLSAPSKGAAVMTAAPVAPLNGATAAATTPPNFLPGSCDALESAGLPPNDWISRRHATIPVRVWARCTSESSSGPDHPSEQRIDRVLALVEQLWPSLVAAMGPPLLDRRPTDPVVRSSGLGDESIDIYLVFDGEVVSRPGVATSLDGEDAGLEDSWISPFSTVASQESGYILLRATGVYEAGFHMTVVHELFHLLQDAHNADLGNWWYVEASATWAEAHWDRIMPFQSGWKERRDAYFTVYSRHSNGFQKRGSAKPLHLPYSDDGPDDPEAYDAFIWPYFMSQTASGSARLPALSAWTAVEGASSPAEADAAMNTVFSFEQNFREFAVRNLNREFLPGDPLPREKRWVFLDDDDDGFRPADGKPPMTLEWRLFADRDQEFRFAVAPLAAHYSSWAFADLRIRKVVFEFDDVAASGLAVDAMLKIFERDWTRVDYTGQRRVTFCIDEPDQNLDMLDLVISHNRLLPPDAPWLETKVRVITSSTPCSTKWVGSATMTSETPISRIVGSASATLRLTEVREQDGVVVHVFKPESGVATVDLFSLHTFGPCSFSPNSSPITPSDFGFLEIVYPRGGDPTAVSGDAGTQWAVTMNCPGSSGPVEGFPIGVVWLLIDQPVKLSANGKELKGAVVREAAGNRLTVTFTYRLVRE